MQKNKFYKSKVEWTHGVSGVAWLRNMFQVEEEKKNYETFLRISFFTFLMSELNDTSLDLPVLTKSSFEYLFCCQAYLAH